MIYTSSKVMRELKVMCYRTSDRSVDFSSKIIELQSERISVFYGSYRLRAEASDEPPRSLMMSSRLEAQLIHELLSLVQPHQIIRQDAFDTAKLVCRQPADMRCDHAVLGLP